MSEARKRLEKRCAEIDAHYARYPTSPDRTAEQHAADLRELLAESDRLRSLVEEAKGVVGLGDAEPWPASPYDFGTAGNCRTAGWNAFFQGNGRDRCPFPPSRRDLLTGYQAGWDAAQSASQQIPKDPTNDPR